LTLAGIAGLIYIQFTQSEAVDVAGGWPEVITWVVQLVEPTCG